jgi:hypothetical protein
LELYRLKIFNQNSKQDLDLSTPGFLQMANCTPTPRWLAPCTSHLSGNGNRTDSDIWLGRVWTRGFASEMEQLYKLGAQYIMPVPDYQGCTDMYGLADCYIC